MGQAIVVPRWAALPELPLISRTPSLLLADCCPEQGTAMGRLLPW